MKQYTCDHCDGAMPEPVICVQYLTTYVDDDGDDCWDDNEVHLCGFSCLSGWSVAQEMADVPTTDTPGG